MARDLIAAVALSPGERILDVGAGTGLTADLARDAIGAAGVVIATDPSTGMLGVARAQRKIVTIAGMTPGLPFPDASFDAAVANLVLSHLPDLSGGVADMVRVLRVGGRLGATAWGPDPAHVGDQSSEADEIVAAVRNQCGLPSEAPVKGAPWEDRLRSRSQLVGSLSEAGLHHVNAALHTYRHTFAIDDFLSGWAGLGRYLRSEAGHERWRQFSDRAAAELRARFGNTIVSVKQAWVVTGTAAASWR